MKWARRHRPARRSCRRQQLMTPLLLVGLLSTCLSAAFLSAAIDPKADLQASSLSEDVPVHHQFVFQLDSLPSASATSPVADDLVGSSPPVDDDPPYMTLIDVLSGSKEHSLLVRLLQRTRLVPTINKLEQATFFAPTDKAIRRAADRERESVRTRSQGQEGLWVQAINWADESSEISYWDDHDNIAERLRQTLLYHILNYTLPYSPLNSSSSSVLVDKPRPPLAPAADMHTTLHLPFLSDSPSRPGPIPSPPPGHRIPSPGDLGGLLAGDGQKVRLSGRPKSSAVEQEKHRMGGDKGGGKMEWFVGTDWKGEEGSRIAWEDWQALWGKGVVVAVDDVLTLPVDLAKTISSHPNLAFINSLLPNHTIATLATSPHLTLFFPSTDAFNALSSLERKYLALAGENEMVMQDVVRLAAMHASGSGVDQRGQVGYTERLTDKDGKGRLTTILGGDIEIEERDGSFIIDGETTLVEGDVFAENGVIHVVDALLTPRHDLQMTLEKYLLALNATRFVSLFHMAGLSDYLDFDPVGSGCGEGDCKEHAGYTVLAFRDDVVEAAQREGSWRALPPDGSMEMADMLKYHIVPGKVTPEDLEDGMLLGTELRDWRLKEGRQRLFVTVGDSSMKERKGNGDVGFGDANVLAEPAVVGNSVIYLISQILEPPENMIQTAVSSLPLSTYVASVFSAALSSTFKRTPGVTYLIPRNSAFSSLGLTMSYLLLSEAKEELRALVKYHAIDEIVYMEDWKRDGKVGAGAGTPYPTLEGEELWVRRKRNGSVEVLGPSGHVSDARWDDMEGAAASAGDNSRTHRTARIVRGDMLTSTGCIHEIDRVQIPPKMDITLGKLMRGAKASTMAELVREAGYGWILDGTDPPPTSESSAPEASKKRRKNKKLREPLKGGAYTILTPTDQAFTRINLTRILEDREALEDLVRLHILPFGSETSLLFARKEGKESERWSVFFSKASKKANNADEDDEASAARPLGPVYPPASPPPPLLPLSLHDTVSFPSLLSRSQGGPSGYGDIAFRRLDSAALGNDADSSDGGGWLVGIKNARGTDGSSVAASIIGFGRETRPRGGRPTVDGEVARMPGDGDQGTGYEDLGGVLLTSAVLLPYEPNWFYRWGWIVIVVLLLCTALGLVGVCVWQLWVKKKREGQAYRPLEGEED